MNRQKIVFLTASLAVLGCALLVFFIVIARPANKNKPLGDNQNPSFSYVTSTTATFSPASRPSNAFINEGNNNIVLPQSPNNETALPTSPTGSASTEISGAKAASLSDVQNIISSALSAKKPATATLLALPNVPDSEIVISPSGVSTALNYLTYFGTHSKDVIFDGKKFDNVLKDKNGIILFVLGLIEKAIADNNFPEVTSSLSIQKEFTEAEINFLKSIPVSGIAIAINKENIGLEELTAGVIDKALAVSSGLVSKNDFINYYNQFNATAESVRRGFVAQSGVLSLNKPTSLADRILGILGIGTAANAQAVDVPFGGTIDLLQPCPCNLGVNVVIGPPSARRSFCAPCISRDTTFFRLQDDVRGRMVVGEV